MIGTPADNQRHEGDGPATKGSTAAANAEAPVAFRTDLRSWFICVSISRSMHRRPAASCRRAEYCRSGGKAILGTIVKREVTGRPHGSLWHVASND
jgi:hypothetical protein